MTQEHGQRTIELLRKLEYTHLPSWVHSVVEPYKRTGWALADILPDSAELTAALQRLVESRESTLHALEEYRLSDDFARE